MTFSDRELSQKLERTEARSNAAFVESRARVDPDVGAEWIEVGGAYAMFDGAESPLTQTFGLGIFEESTPEHLDRLEAFLQDRGAPVFHEVSPMTDPSLLNLLNDRGYKPIELTSVMYRVLENKPAEANRDERLSTHVIAQDEVEIWARTAANGWATEAPELVDFLNNMGRISAQCEGAHPYIAELEGTPVSTGMLFIHDDMCLLAGASTIPSARKKGAQTALLADRLDFAVAQGCTMAMMCAAPGSQSQKNAQRNGFEIAYTRIKWRKT